MLLHQGCLDYALNSTIPKPNETADTVYIQIAGGTTTLSPDITLWSAVLTEAVLTLMLVTVVLMVAVDTYSKNMLGPLAIGCTLAVSIFAG